VPAASFTWTTAQQSAVGITLSRVSHSVLGTAVKLVLSSYTCTHPALGSLANPMATGTYTSYPLTTTQAAQTSTTISLSSFQIPSAVSTVLVEVTDGNSTLYSKRQTVASLTSLSLAFPDSPPSSQVLGDAAYLDACP
jgi:hypothetical protein